EIVGSQPIKQEQLVDRYREAKGAAYTNALAEAIPQLAKGVQTRAREALVDRLVQMTSATLKDKLGEENLEIRRAAVIAIAQKEKRELTPQMIELLQDPEPPVAGKTHSALTKLRGGDLGPAEDASRQERADAVAAWKAWWTKYGKK